MSETVSEAIKARVKGKRAIRSYARKLGEVDTVKDLNIVPMMDMMTIILVFLLKSFSTSTNLITQDENLSLAQSETQMAAKQAVMLTITKRVVLVEGEGVAPINNGKVDPALKQTGENSFYITPIVDVLTKIARRERKVAALQGQAFEGELLVIADRYTPYRLLTEILYSSGQAGYANYRLMVLKKGD
jgi:biopolymer transport protein ExbD